MKERPTQECDSLEEIIDILSSGAYPELTYVGKQYTKADLIRDLKKVEWFIN